jgi:hypothetical protein
MCRWVDEFKFLPEITDDSLTLFCHGATVTAFKMQWVVLATPSSVIL